MHWMRRNRGKTLRDRGLSRKMPPLSFTNAPRGNRTRTAYRVVVLPVGVLSRIPIPVRQLPEIIIPTAEMCGQATFQSGYLRPVHFWQYVVIADHDLVELDVDRRPLHRIEFPLGLTIEIVILLALPPGNVAALPFVLFARRFP